MHEEEQELFLVESAVENVVKEEEEDQAMSDENEAAVEDDVDVSPIFEEVVKVDVHEEEQELVAE